MEYLDQFLKIDSRLSAGKPTAASVNWNVLVVDDDHDVHIATRRALKDLQFDGRGINFMSAYSAVQARVMLATELDIAVVLLDVVMETEDAGLRLVRFIRDELKNANVRIVLRTGQAGQAPAEEIILKYDINDYKSKAELTGTQLFTSTVTALRAYGQLRTLEAHRYGLQRIIDISNSLFKEQSLQGFASRLLMQLSAFFGVGAQGILCAQRPQVDADFYDNIQVLAASNSDGMEQCQDWTLLDLEPDVRALILATFEQKGNLYGPRHTTLYFGRGHSEGMVAYLHCQPLHHISRDLVELFCSKVTTGYRNVRLYEELSQANVHLEQRVRDRSSELAEANRQLTHFSTTDPLTGVPNRRHFQEALEREVVRSDRDGLPFCVVMLDIDHFKEVNDSHGRIVGDRVLQGVVERLGREMRQMDLLGRLGGEEFAALLPCIALPDAVVVADRLRIKMAESPVHVNELEIPVTISLGVVQSAPGQPVAELLSLADSALSTAKNGGRDRVYGASAMVRMSSS